MTNPTIIAVGELLVEFVSHSKGCELRSLSQYSGPYPSGAPAICIDQAARVGAATQIFGGVGNDNFGVALIERLRTNGVETAGIEVIDGQTTGVAFVSYFEDGLALPQSPLIMHISGSSLGNPKLREAIESTATLVIEQGGQISCDPNARAELMSDSEVKTTLTTLIAKSSFLFPSDSDLDYLYPECSEQQAIENLQALGVDTIALTRGEEGAVIYSKDNERLSLGGHTVEEIDPTGAGDCFCGTFLAMIAQGQSIETSGQYANAAGAIAVTKRGPMEGNSDLETIKAFMLNNPAKRPS